VVLVAAGCALEEDAHVHRDDAGDGGRATVGTSVTTVGTPGAGGASSSTVVGDATGGATGAAGGAAGTGGAGTTGGAGGKGGAAGSATGTGGGGGGDQAVVCSSNKTWNSATGSKGEMMRPGETCLNCHNYYASGTVYPTLHEPNDCYGVDGAARNYEVAVVLTDAKGVTAMALVNSWGNFLMTDPVTPPFHAKLVDMSTGRERAMVAAQTQRDCNSCHTQNGANGSPGRILLP
jgi:hypothetical protein